MISFAHPAAFRRIPRVQGPPVNAMKKLAETEKVEEFEKVDTFQKVEEVELQGGLILEVELTPVSQEPQFKVLNSK